MKGSGERPALEVRVEGLPGRVAEERVDAGRLGPVAPFGAQHDDGACGEARRLPGRPGLDGPGGGALPNREVGDTDREVEEGGELLPGHRLAGPTGHDERRGELVEDFLQPGEGVEVPPGEVRRASGCPAPHAGPIDEGVQPRYPLGRRGGRRQGSEGPAQVANGVGGSHQRQSLSPRPPRSGEQSGPTPQPFLGVAAPLDRTGPVEQEAKARLRVGRAQVRRGEERFGGGPVDRARRPEGGAQVSNEWMSSERAGHEYRQRDAEAGEGGRQQFQESWRGEDGDVVGLEGLVEQGRRKARGGVALLGVAGRRQPHHPAPGDHAGGGELDADVAPDRELVE